jgi:hypothetical protein
MTPSPPSGKMRARGPFKKRNFGPGSPDLAVAGLVDAVKGHDGTYGHTNDHEVCYGTGEGKRRAVEAAAIAMEILAQIWHKAAN